MTSKKEQKRILNVGGNDINVIPMPKRYDDWKKEVLDIDPKAKPDLLCDAREMETQKPNIYDAIYCAHNLEHYFHHHAEKVLKGFSHVLKEDGFIEIWVPDLVKVMKFVVEKNLDIDSVLYNSQAGPILVRDVIYGYGKEIEHSGNDFYAHKTGFSQRSLNTFLKRNGFPVVFIAQRGAAFEAGCVAFKKKPSKEQEKLLGFKYDDIYGDKKKQASS